MGQPYVGGDTDVSVAVALGGCANLTAPSALTDPATLLNAPLADIHTALAALASQGAALLATMPPSIGSSSVSCDEEGTVSNLRTTSCCEPGAQIERSSCAIRSSRAPKSSYSSARRSSQRQSAYLDE